MTEIKRDPALDALQTTSNTTTSTSYRNGGVAPAAHSAAHGPPAEPRGASPLRAVRLPKALDEQLTSYAQQSG